MANSGPGYQKNPEHRVDLKPGPSRVEVRVSGETIADTANAIALHESGYPVVYYIPRSDVRMDRLVRTPHHTRCPFKGEASYFNIIPNGAENAVWTYEQPYDEVLAIKDHVAFYPNKVDAIVAT
jgi:uncharacterized protein (DUF427 family)